MTDDERPFEIPDTWEWTRLGSVFVLQAGKNVPAGLIEESGTYPCYGGNGIRGYISKFNRDGIFPIIGRQGALCGNIKLAEGKFFATEHAVVVETFAQTSARWVEKFLIALNLNQYATATAQPGISVQRINIVPIPITPLAEQERIVAKLEHLCEPINLLKAALVE
ncbi:MAG: restriction endonuclease subunit S [Varibaculum sp.]|nr:restriction endonuclease subunit S [Varibaculum sp.]